jgi:hypothetical protein
LVACLDFFYTEVLEQKIKSNRVLKQKRKSNRVPTVAQPSWVRSAGRRRRRRETLATRAWSSGGSLRRTRVAVEEVLVQRRFSFWSATEAGGQNRGGEGRGQGGESQGRGGETRGRGGVGRLRAGARPGGGCLPWRARRPAPSRSSLRRRRLKEVGVRLWRKRRHGSCGEEAVDGVVKKGRWTRAAADGVVEEWRWIFGPVSYGAEQEERAGRGEMSGGASDPCVSGPGAWTRGVIFGRLQLGRVEKLDLSFSIGQGREAFFVRSGQCPVEKAGLPNTRIAKNLG